MFVNEAQPPMLMHNSYHVRCNREESLSKVIDEYFKVKGCRRTHLDEYFKHELVYNLLIFPSRHAREAEESKNFSEVSKMWSERIS